MGCPIHTHSVSLYLILLKMYDVNLFQVVVCLYILSALGRLVSGVTVAYAGMLWLTSVHIVTSVN